MNLRDEKQLSDLLAMREAYPEGIAWDYLEPIQKLQLLHWRPDLKLSQDENKDKDDE